MADVRNRGAQERRSHEINQFRTKFQTSQTIKHSAEQTRLVPACRENLVCPPIVLCHLVPAD